MAAITTATDTKIIAVAVNWRLSLMFRRLRFA
jgi:hypothetical protein